MGKSKEIKSILINGRSARVPGGTTYTLRKVNYKKYLSGVKERFHEGLGPYFDIIIKSPTEAGAFNLIRAIVPVIEIVARAQGIGIDDLLSRLGVPAPNLMWNLYRDVLSHNDRWMNVKIGAKYIEPSIWISLGGTVGSINMHIVNHRTGTHTLNVGTLYHDLLEYLEREIEAADEDKKIDIIAGIEYLEGTEREEVQRIITEVKIVHQYEQAKEERWYARLNAKQRRIQKENT